MSTNEWLRLPGLFRRWEFEQVLEPGNEFHIEEAGHAQDGAALFAIYHRPHTEQEENDE